MGSCKRQNEWAINHKRDYGETRNQECVQIKTWMKWYRENEIHRFDQPIGKQYSYGHGPDFKSETEKKDTQMAHLKMENEILKKYLEMVKELKKE